MENENKMNEQIRPKQESCGLLQYKYLIEKLNLIESEEDLISLLILPEMREENNSDLPFLAKGRLRINACGDFIQALPNEHLTYFREDQFVADWMEKLTRNPGFHCFDGKIGAEFTYPDGKHLSINLNRNEGKSTLSADLDGKPGETIEIWKEGLLMQSFSWSPSFEPEPTPIQDGTALFIRRGSADEGIEVLVDEGEFGTKEWKALLTGMCIQGAFQKALQVLQMKAEEILGSSKVGTRFEVFLENMKSFTKMEGYVLMPMPLVRGESSFLEETPVIFDSLATETDSEWFIEGWKNIAGRDFMSAGKAFDTFYSNVRNEWSIPLEGILTDYLELVSDNQLTQRSRLHETTRFWEKVFETINS